MKLHEMQARPATIHFTSRCDARHLATLALMWTSQGEAPRSISELVRLSIETFAEILVTSGKAEFINSQSAAQEVLGRLGIIGKGLQKKNLIEAIIKEGNLSSLESSPLTIRQSGLAKDAPDVMAAAKALDELLDKESFSARQLTETKDLLEGLSMAPNHIENGNGGE